VGGVQAAIQAMNDVWQFHDYWDETSDVVTRCLAFVVDDPGRGEER
jgi:hypothetical protein